VVFPGTTFAEKDGTFTNHAGRVQRINKVIETPPDWLDDGGIFTALMNRLEGRKDEFALERVWAAMERDGSRFASLRLDLIGPEGVALEPLS
jgi:predicted molibdopterin-dependent oxidoreductase YjgC